MASHTMTDQFADTFRRVRKRSSTAMRHGRTAVADTLDSAATRVDAGGKQIAAAAHATSDRMEASAKWVRTTSGRDLVRKVTAMIRAHPGRTAVGAVALGLVAARAIRHR